MFIKLLAIIANWLHFLWSSQFNENTLISNKSSIVPIWTFEPIPFKLLLVFHCVAVSVLHTQYNLIKVMSSSHLQYLLTKYLVILLHSMCASKYQYSLPIINIGRHTQYIVQPTAYVRIPTYTRLYFVRSCIDLSLYVWCGRRIHNNPTTTV